MFLTMLGVDPVQNPLNLYIYIYMIELENITHFIGKFDYKHRTHSSIRSRDMDSLIDYWFAFIF